MHRPSFVVFAILILCTARLPAVHGQASAPPASAPPAAEAVEPAPDGEPQSAAGHLATARQFFNERKYFDAAEALRRAHALEPKPIYLFNAGTAYRKGEKLGLALEMYQRYVDAVPEGSLSNEARAYIKDLTDLLDARKRLEANSQALQGANQLLENERTQVQQTQQALQLEKQRADEIRRELEKVQKKKWYRRPPFIVFSTALVGAGVIVGIAAIIISQSGQTRGGTHEISF